MLCRWQVGECLREVGLEVVGVLQSDVEPHEPAVVGEFGLASEVVRDRWHDETFEAAPAGAESLVMPAIPHHLRSKPVLPDDGRLVRLHIGLEHPDDLKSDLAQALTNLTPAPH